MVAGLIVLSALLIDKNNIIPVVGDLSTTAPLTSIGEGGKLVETAVTTGFLDLIFFKGNMIMMLMFAIFSVYFL